VDSHVKLVNQIMYMFMRNCNHRKSKVKFLVMIISVVGYESMKRGTGEERVNEKRKQSFISGFYMA